VIQSRTCVIDMWPLEKGQAQDCRVVLFCRSAHGEILSTTYDGGAANECTFVCFAETLNTANDGGAGYPTVRFFLCSFCGSRIDPVFLVRFWF
jgi:hypothetical protein